MELLDEVETPYVKGSQRETPPKADHKHEYVRPIMFNRIRRFDGTITSQKYKFWLPERCIDCGHRRRHWHTDVIEVELSVREFHKMRDAEDA